MTDARSEVPADAPNSFWAWIFRPTGLICLFAFALSLRALYLWELRDFALYLHPIVDAETYDSWAEAILRGERFDSGVFYQDPLFPYLLAALYGLTVNSTILATILQVVLDAATCVLLALIGKRVFSPMVGGLTGIGAAVYGAFVFNTAILEKTTVSLFAVTAALHLLLRVAEKPSRLRTLVAGVVFGLAVLLRGNIYLFAPLAVAWLAWTFRRTNREWVVLTATFCLGAGLAIAPVTVRNYVVGGDFVLTTSQSGWNFYKGTSAEANGFLNDPLNTNNVPSLEEKQVHALAEQRTGRKLKPSEMSKYWWDQGIAYIRANPWDYFELNLLKLWYVFNAYEIPDSYDFYYFRDHSLVLRMLIVGFWLVSPLGILGIALALRRPTSAQVLLIAFVGTYAASVVLFYVASRYRMPMAPVLMMFSGLTIQTVYGWFRSGAIKPAVLTTLIAIGMIALLSTNTAERHINADYFACTEANALLNHGEPERALEIYERIFRRDRNRLVLIEGRASALLEVGRVAEAIAELRRAWRIAPLRASLYARLISAYEVAGDADRADVFRTLRQLLQPGGGGRKRLTDLLERADPEVRLDTFDAMAWLAFKSDNLPAANDAWDKYLALRPDSPRILLQVFHANENHDPRRAALALRNYLRLSDELGTDRRATLQRRLERLERKM